MPVPVQGMGLCMSHVSSIMVAGYGCVGMGYAGFLGKWGGERESGKKIFQKSSSPLSLHLQGRRTAQCRSKRHRAVCFVFFLRKGK